MPPRRAAVIGAGIAGVATAAALRRDDWQVDLFERAPRLRLGGGVLMLWPNGLEALERLGLAAAVRARGVALHALRVYGWSGRLVLGVAAPRWRELLGEVPVYIERQALLETLRETWNPAPIHFGRELVELDGATPIFTGSAGLERPRRDYELLVGADGIHSRVSACLGNAATLAEIGTLWLGRVTAAGHAWLPPPGEVVIVHGRRFRVILGMLPARPREPEALEWTVYDNHSRSRAHPAALEPGELARELRGCALPVAELVRRTAAHTRLTLRVLPPGHSWRRGPAVLVGDAAHASSPELGQGACQSFESALALANALARASDVPTALARFERERRARASAVSSAAQLTTLLAGLGGPTIDALRDLIVAPGWNLLGRHLVRAVAARLTS